MMQPVLLQLDTMEAAAAAAAAAAVALGASPEQTARAVLVALRALPRAASSLVQAQIFDLGVDLPAEEDVVQDLLVQACTLNVESGDLFESNFEKFQLVGVQNIREGTCGVVSEAGSLHDGASSTECCSLVANSSVDAEEAELADNGWLGVVVAESIEVDESTKKVKQADCIIDEDQTGASVNHEGGCSEAILAHFMHTAGDIRRWLDNLPPGRPGAEDLEPKLQASEAYLSAHAGDSDENHLAQLCEAVSDEQLAMWDAELQDQGDELSMAIDTG